MLPPDNFFYFITLFFISIFCGTYLLFSYYRNKLLILNALMFFGCGIRACTEYYLPEVKTFEAATNLAIFHSILIVFISFLLWYCAWFYIRPFKNSPKEAIINQIYTWIILFLPLVIGIIQCLLRQAHYFHPEQLDGYWKFQPNNESIVAIGSVFYIQGMTFLTILVLLSDIKKRKKNRFKKIGLLISFVVLPILYFKYLDVPGQWNIPNVGGIFLAHTLIISWFVSDYRLFHNNFEAATNDVLNSISELVISTDLNLNITNTNNKTNQLFSPPQKGFLKFLTQQSNLSEDHIKDLISLLIKQEAEQVELQIRDIDNVMRAVQIKVASLVKGQSHLGYTFLITDLTDIRAKEQELELLNRTKDRLFAIIGHDLRKPALAFRGISQKVNFLIRQKEFDTLKEFGHSLEKSAFSLNNLLDNLLNWALGQRNVLPYQPMPINVTEAIKDIHKVFSQIATNKGIDLVIDIEKDSTIFGDPNAFTTIVRNLLDNAIKYTPVGGTVELSTQAFEQGVLVKIADTGVGIKEERLESLFQLEQNKNTKGTNGETGSGLGLILVKDLVELNKGTINVVSNWNKGTSFEIFLPAA